MIKKIGVLGLGTMGSGITMAFAINGYDVNAYDIISVEKLQAAKEAMRPSLELFVEEGFMPKENIQATLDRIKVFTDLKKAVEDRDFVIENVPEKIEIKQNTFKQLDEYCPEHTILASNTSSLKLNDMMALVSEKRKSQMMVNHFYNPPHIMPIVELSYFGNTSEAVYKDVEELYHSIKKQTVKVLKDVPGLVANRIQQGVAREAFSIIEQGIAAPEDVDKALIFGPAFRYATTGQLEVADFGGLDIWCTVGDNLLKIMDNSTGANKLLRDKVAEGKLGLKTGEGFYKYSPADAPQIQKQFLKRLIHQLKASEYYVK
ncbi:MAG: hbd 3 [Firmicutes bacterium]|nr:hbd 3 [Bacillota bacterium]